MIKSIFKKYKKMTFRIAAATLIISLAVIFLDAVFLAKAFFNLNNNPSRLYTKTRGITVSYLQGEIDWRAVKNLGVDFSYIYATEGGIYADSCLQQNIRKTDGIFKNIGFIHKLDLSFSGKIQAENFINAVGHNGILPPAVDITEIKILSDSDYAKEILNEFIDVIQSRYGSPPIIICNEKSYRKMIKGSFDELQLWDTGSISENYPDAKVVFKKYTDRLKITGTSGESKVSGCYYIQKTS